MDAVNRSKVDESCLIDASCPSKSERSLPLRDQRSFQGSVFGSINESIQVPAVKKLKTKMT